MTAHTVIAILEAKPEKEAELKQALINVIEPSRSEKTCIEYRLHQSTKNKNEFILYENWKSQEAHQEQFKKPYILDLVNKIENILAKPYEVYFANELS